MISVNQQVAASVGTALMSVILTGQFNRSANISAAHATEVLRDNAAQRGVPLDESALPPAARDPTFPVALVHDLAHAYAVVFVFAAVLVGLTFVPVAFLPKSQAAQRV